MRERAAGLPTRRRNFTSAVLVFLLVLAGAARESTIVAMLRGRSSIEDELRQARTQGYYEKLLGTPRGSKERVANGQSPPPGMLPFRDAGIVEVVPTYVRWRMRPNLDLRWNGTTFRTNSQGFRTPEIASEKPRGTYRVLVFGSSYSMGHGVDDEDVYPRRLERWLIERVGPGRRVEVVNFAVSGDSPSRRLERLREEAGHLDADWVLCEATPLDYSLEESHLLTMVVNKTPIPYEFVRAALRRAGVTTADSPAAFHRKLRGECERLLVGAFAGWSAAAKRLGIPVAVVILPRSDCKETNPRMRRLIRSLARRHGLEALDISDTFDDLALEEIQASPWDPHPGVLGHRAIFEALRAALEQRGGLPGLPLPRSAAR